MIQVDDSLCLRQEGVLTNTAIDALHGIPSNLFTVVDTAQLSLPCSDYLPPILLLLAWVAVNANRE